MPGALHRFSLTGNQASAEIDRSSGAAKKDNPATNKRATPTVAKVDLFVPRVEIIVARAKMRFAPSEEFFPLAQSLPVHPQKRRSLSPQRITVTSVFL
jgi:hypothetical protein